MRCACCERVDWLYTSLWSLVQLVWLPAQARGAAVRAGPCKLVQRHRLWRQLEQWLVGRCVVVVVVLSGCRRQLSAALLPRRVSVKVA